MSPSRGLLLAVCATFVVACSVTAGEPEQLATVTTSLGVGVLPPPITASGTTAPAAPATSVSTTTTTILPVGEVTVGEIAAGTRVLMIGDSLLASVSQRYDDELCAVMVPLGWQVQVEAEVSRQIGFANVVLDELGVGRSGTSQQPSTTVAAGAPTGSDSWDAALIFLGTNYDRDALDYLKQLNGAIVRLGPIPIVVVLVTEYDPAMIEVNRVIESIDELYDNVRVLDWRAVTALDAPEHDDLLTADGIHLTDAGRAALSSAIAAEFGRVAASPGACLEQVFVDDPEPLPDGSVRPTTVTTVKPSVKPPPTPRPTTTTSAPPDSTTTTAPDGGGGGGEGGGDGSGDGGGG